MVDKIKMWLIATGLTNFAYLAAAVACFILGYPILMGAALGIFVYVNFNVIKKLVTGAVDKL